MTQTKTWTQAEMEKRLVRYADLKGLRNAFIDARTPGSDRKENFLARKENNSTFRAKGSDIRVFCSRRRAIRCKRKVPRFAIGEHFSTRREMSLALAVRGRNVRLRQAQAAVRAVSGEVSAASGWGALPFVRVMAESVKAFRNQSHGCILLPRACSRPAVQAGATTFWLRALMQ